MKKFRVSVCKGPDCKGNGSDAVHAAFKSEIAKQGLAERCQLYRGGCYGLCQLGANVVIREDVGRPRDPLSREDFQLMGWEGETYYPRMDAAKAARVAESHLARAEVVRELEAKPEEVDAMLADG